MIYEEFLHSLDGLSPVHKTVDIRMAADTRKLFDMSGNFYSFTEQLYTLCPLDKGTAESISCLIAHEKDRICLDPQVMLEMVLDTSCLAHTAG